MADIARRYIAALTQRPRWVVGATLVVTVVLGYQAIGLRIRSDPDSMFPPEHPYVRIDAKVRRQFGGWHYVLIAVKATQGSVWSPSVLSVVHDITQDVRYLPGVLPNAIFSFASPNVRVIQDDAGVLAPRYLMREVPETSAGVDALKQTVLENDVLRKGLVSEDQTATIVSADFDDSVTEQEISDALEAIVAARKTDAVEIYFTGGPVLLHAYNVYVFQVWQRFLLAFAIIAGLLYLSFGTFQGMVIPLASGGLSTCWAVGLMGWTGVKVDQWNTITPILVMGITAGHSTQLLKRYYEELTITRDNRQAVELSLLHVAPVMLAAGLTAALGFASLAAFRVPSLRTFGVFTALGILCGLVIELSFIPAIRCLIAPRVHPDPPLDRVFVRVISRVTSSLARGVHWPYLVTFGALAIWAIVGVFRITADFSFVSYLPHGTVGERNFLAAQRLFPGTLPLVILIEGREPIAADPHLIRTVSSLQKRLEAESAVVYTTSYVDIMRQAAIAFDGSQPRPGDSDFSRELAAQLLFLSYSPHYETFLTRDLKRAVVWVFLREAPTATIQGVIDDAKRFVEAQGPQEAWNVQIGGGVAATRVALTESIVRGKIANIVIVLGVIFVVSSVIFRSPLGGVLVLLPLVFTVLVDLGILGNFGIPLDPITASVAAMAVGIGADYAIYLIYRMREEVARGADAPEAIDRAMTSAGRGIFCVAAAIAGGYLTLSISSFRAFTMVGLLVSSTMIFSSLVSLTLLPLVILRLRPRLVFGTHIRNTEQRRAS